MVDWYPSKGRRESGPTKGTTMNTYFLRLAITVGQTRFTRRVMGRGVNAEAVRDAFKASRPELIDLGAVVVITERVQLADDDTVVELP